MAKDKKPKEEKKEEKIFIIPLRNEWRKVANYRRAGRAIKSIKQYIAKHMKVPERDVSKVKLDLYLNQEIWFKGKKKPPAKIKVKAFKDGENIKVELAEIPQHWKFVKLNKLKAHLPKVEKKVEKPSHDKEDKKDLASPQGVDKERGRSSKGEGEKTPEEKKDEKEKTISSAEDKAKVAQSQAKQMEKATSKRNQTPIHRQALKK